MNRRMHRSGQMLLITVLMLTIAVTVGLSLIGRATIDVSMSAQLEESQRAFAAAEAGIEEALKNPVVGEKSAAVMTGTNYQTQVQSIGGEANAVLTTPTAVTSGDVTTVWLLAHNSDGILIEDSGDASYEKYGGTSLDVCWMQGTSIPAVEISVLYKSGNAYLTSREAYDPDGTRAAANHFTSDAIGSSGCGLESGVYMKAISLPAGTPIALRVRPYYSDTIIRVQPQAGATFPTQGQVITSVGKSEGGATRKIIVNRKFDEFPSIFDYAVFSQSSFVR